MFPSRFRLLYEFKPGQSRIYTTITLACALGEFNLENEIRVSSFHTITRILYDTLVTQRLRSP